MPQVLQPKEFLNCILFKAGADYVIVGRAIYKAEDPKAVAKAICEEIRTVL